jgi:hypothetical protein
MFRRRRPLARAAVIGGTAYAANKYGQNKAMNQMAEEDQEARLQQLEAQQAAQAAPAAPAAPAASGAGSEDMVAQLQNLKKLLDEGVLTQAEFDLQKQKILAG